jgi:hypothetical protein
MSLAANIPTRRVKIAAKVKRGHPPTVDKAFRHSLGNACGLPLTDINAPHKIPSLLLMVFANFAKW